MEQFYEGFICCFACYIAGKLFIAGKFYFYKSKIAGITSHSFLLT